MGSQNMMKVVVIALVASAAMGAVLQEEEYESLWQAFVKEHSKTYSPHEVMGRYAVFKDNLDFIVDHNKNHAERLGYTAGVNEFADMTNAEFKRQMTGLNALQNKKQENVELLNTDNLAASVDWTTKNAVTPVKNQGQCGSCWAFSTTGSVEGINAIKTGKLESFSEQELVSCAGSYGNQGCNGGLMDNGFKYIMSKGDVLESKYPYTGKTGTCIQSKVKSVVKVTGFKDVPASNEAQLMAAVAQQPVSVAIEADQSGFQFYKSGVFSGKCGTKLDHGVLTVGYGTQDGKAYWKVKNSWGTSWGQKGYILMARNISNKHGQCGIAMQPSYPEMSHAPAPTPTPTPTPPPTPTPTPPPGPSSGPYEAPPCASNEDAVQVQGLSGDFCSPKCSLFKPCPAAPSGTAKGKCILESQGKSMPSNCALECTPGSNGQCPTGASCQPIQGVGICTYPASTKAPVPTFLQVKLVPEQKN